MVMPVPESGGPAAQGFARTSGIPYGDGLVKNRYIGRTFIMPGQTIRKKSVRQKLTAISMEFKRKNVLVVDDSIVRGTTSREIVQMAREAGANKVFFASSAPPVRFPNVYGIDMPTRAELIATGRTEDEIARHIEADGVIYQDLEALKAAVREANPKLERFEASCFDGNYVTGDVTTEYLAEVEHRRDDKRQETPDELDGEQADLSITA
jgi:amidophosphoribosyltransferase